MGLRRLLLDRGRMRVGGGLGLGICKDKCQFWGELKVWWLGEMVIGRQWVAEG